MKQLILSISLLISFASFAQSTSIERDSVAQTSAFRIKVKMAAHKAANDLLADDQTPATIKKYAQLIVSVPDGQEWLPALSYGVMTNVAINHDSSDGDIQFTINSIFTKYAKAYYREP
jgi:hypothetical protein